VLPKPSDPNRCRVVNDDDDDTFKTAEAGTPGGPPHVLPPPLPGPPPVVVVHITRASKVAGTDAAAPAIAADAWGSVFRAIKLVFKPQGDGLSTLANTSLIMGAEACAALETVLGLVEHSVTTLPPWATVYRWAFGPKPALDGLAYVVLANAPHARWVAFVVGDSAVVVPALLGEPAGAGVSIAALMPGPAARDELPVPSLTSGTEVRGITSSSHLTALTVFFWVLEACIKLKCPASRMLKFGTVVNTDDEPDAAEAYVASADAFACFVGINGAGGGHL
jgi:hypothetical protein